MVNAQPGREGGRLGVPSSIDPERDATDVYNALIDNVRGQSELPLILLSQ